MTERFRGHKTHEAGKEKRFKDYQSPLRRGTPNFARAWAEFTGEAPHQKASEKPYDSDFVAHRVYEQKQREETRAMQNMRRALR